MIVVLAAALGVIRDRCQPCRHRTSWLRLAGRGRRRTAADPGQRCRGATAQAVRRCVATVVVC